MVPLYGIVNAQERIRLQEAASFPPHVASYPRKKFSTSGLVFP